MSRTSRLTSLLSLLAFAAVSMTFAAFSTRAEAKPERLTVSGPVLPLPKDDWNWL